MDYINVRLKADE